MIDIRGYLIIEGSWHQQIGAAVFSLPGVYNNGNRKKVISMAKTVSIGLQDFGKIQDLNTLY